MFKKLSARIKEKRMILICGLKPKLINKITVLKIRNQKIKERRTNDASLEKERFIFVCWTD